MAANINQYADVLRFIEQKIVGALMPSNLRQCFEVEIIVKLTEYIKNIDASLQSCLFGSCHYGIQSLNANLNMLVTTSMSFQFFLIHVFFRSEFQL